MLLMKKTKKFMINAGILTATSLLLRSLGLSFSVYLSKTIGAEAMGTYHLILSVYFFSVTVATSGIGLTMTKLIAEEMAVGDEQGVFSLLKKGVFYCLFFSILSAVLLFCLAPVLVKFCFGNRISEKPIYLLAIGLPFLSVASALSGYFTAGRKVFRTSVGQIAEQALKIGATVCFLFFAKGKGLTEVCSALVVGSTVGEIFSFLYLWMLFSLERKRGTVPIGKKGQWKKLFGFSLPLAFSSYLRSGLSSIKQLSIPARLGKSGISNAVAQYGMVNGMVFPILLFPQVLLTAFSSLLVPEVTEKYALGQSNSLKNILTRIFKITLIFSVAIGGILFLYAGDLCRSVYQNGEIAFYLKLLAPLTVIMYLDDIVDAVLKGINCQVAVVRINILDSLMSIILLWNLLPVFHIKGYLMTIYISEILNGTLSILKLMEHTDFSLSPIRWIVVPAVVIWIAMIASKVLVPFSMVGSMVLSVLLYFGILYVVGIVDYRDFRL